MIFWKITVQDGREKDWKANIQINNEVVAIASEPPSKHSFNLEPNDDLTGSVLCNNSHVYIQL